MSIADMEGKAAPCFTLTAGDGNTISLSDFKGKKNVVLYFYPKDDTPGCTKEACAFRDIGGEYDALDTQVLGVSRDDTRSHAKFSEKFQLNFPLLADTEGAVTEAYGVWQEKNMYGKTYMGIQRATFIIDKEGIVRKVYPKVSVDGHATEIQDFIKTNL